MFSLVKQVLIVLFSFSTLAFKCLSFYDETCMVRPTVLILNPVGPK